MAIDTKPDLTNDKFEQYSGQTLSLSGCTDIYGKLEVKENASFIISDGTQGTGKLLCSDSSGKGTWYTPQFIQDATNGITKVGNTVVLGGTLTGNTVINGNSYDLTISGLTNMNLSLNNSLIGVNNGSFIACGGNGTCNGYYQVCNSGGIKLTYSDTSVGQWMCFNGSMTITDNLGGKGLEYTEDYSTNFTDNSLVTKSYVTGLTSNLTINANNGIVKSGDTISLGGILTGNTHINGTGFDFTIDSNYLSVGSISSLCGSSASLTLNSSVGGTAIICGGPGILIVNGGLLQYTNNDGCYFYFGACGSSCGLHYGGDYSANADPRWIPDNAYVTGLTSGNNTLASNGLTKSGNVIILGGTLTGDTGIDINTNTLCNYTSTSWISHADDTIEIAVNTGATGIYFDCGADYSEIYTLGAACIFVDGSNTCIKACIPDGGVSLSDNGGLKYDADYSGNYTERSIPDVAYVTGLTSNLGSSSGENITKEITQALHGFAVGDFVGWSGGTYNKAIADGSYDGEFVGIVSEVPNTNTFCLTQAGYITGMTGLVTNSTYYLSPTTAGLITSTEPTTDGEISKAILIANSTTTGWVLPYPGIVISSGATVVSSADNGLTNNSGVVELGGTLCQNTTITGQFNLELGNSSNSLNNIDIWGSGDTTIYGTNLNLTSIDQAIYLEYNTGIRVVDGNSIPMYYNADYSANIGPRSIPDAAWVTGQTSTGGISWTGSTVNGIATYVDSSTVCAQNNMTFDGSTLTVTGITCGTTCSRSPIICGSTCVRGAIVCATDEFINTSFCTEGSFGACTIGKHYATDCITSGVMLCAPTIRASTCLCSTAFQNSGAVNFIALGSGTQANILYYDTTLGGVTYGAAPSTVTWTGSQADGIATYVSSTSVCAETNLTFNGSNLLSVGCRTSTNTYLELVATSPIRYRTDSLVGGWQRGIEAMSGSTSLGGYYMYGSNGNNLVCLAMGNAYNDAELVVVPDSCVSLRYDGNEKLTTQSYGVNIAGVSCSTTCSRSPVICGTTSVISPLVCGTVVSGTDMCALWICAQTGDVMGIGAGETGGCIKANAGAGEILWLGAESGIRVVSTPDNWATGWVGRNQATLVDTSGDSTFPGGVEGTIVCGTTCVQAPILNSTSCAIICGSGSVMGLISSESNPYLGFYDSTPTRIGYVRGCSTNNEIRIVKDGGQALGVHTSYVCASGIFCANTCVVTPYLNGCAATANNSACLGGVLAACYLRADALDCKTAGNLRFYDNVCATFGTGADLDVFHNGSHAYISNLTGNMYFRVNDTEVGIAVVPNSCAQLYYDNAAKLKTQIDGACIFGCGYATDFVASSDCRLKKNFTTINNALSIVNNLCGMCYDWCDDNTNDIGLIAQDVEKVVPQLVSHTEPTEEQIDKYNISDNDLRGIKYDKLTAILIEAVKDQQKQIEKLNEEINKLKS